MDIFEESKYTYIEELNECDICYNKYKELFKCRRCTFLCCPKCFNNFYFLHDVTYCPMCRF